MGKCKRVLRCYHCGDILQCDNPKEKGYIDEEALNREVPIQIIYCNQCYESMKAFNNSALDLEVDNEILKILDDAVKKDGIIIWVHDLFAFNGQINSEILEKVKNLKIVAIGTKRDLIPRNVPDNVLKEFLENAYLEYGVTPFKTLILGNADKVDMESLLDELKGMSATSDFYMIGTALNGKTTLINRMLKHYTNNSGRIIRTLPYKGTSAKVLEIPLSKKQNLFELPGLSLSTSMISKMEKDVLKFIIPKKEARVFNKTLNVGECIAVGSLMGIELLKGKTTGFRFFSADGVECKKIASKALWNHIRSNNEHKTLRPVSEHLISFLDYDVFEYSMENDGKLHDISVEGFGWLTFVAKGQVIRLTLPKGVSIKEHLSKVK